MKLIRTEDAVGQVLCHDITQIIPGVTKDAVFRKGHIVREEDIPVLLSVGKEHLYVWENDETKLHENDAAQVLRQICQGENMEATEPKEGKIELIAACDGLFLVDLERLRAINSLGEMMIATRPSGFVVKKGDKLCGTRVIPLVIEKEKMERAKQAAGEKPLLRLLPLKRKRYGVVTTGSEVAAGRIADQFTPVIQAKLAEFGCQMASHVVLGGRQRRHHRRHPGDAPGGLRDGVLHRRHERGPRRQDAPGHPQHRGQGGELRGAGAAGGHVPGVLHGGRPARLRPARLRHVRQAHHFRFGPAPAAGGRAHHRGVAGGPGQRGPVPQLSRVPLPQLRLWQGGVTVDGEFTHVDQAGNARMVDVSGKAVTHRTAVAQGTITMSGECFALVKAGPHEERRRAGGGPGGGHHGRQAHQRPDPPVPYPEPHQVPGGVHPAGGPPRHPGPVYRLLRRQDRRGDGGPHRGLGGPAHRLRHVQGRGQADGALRHPPAGKARGQKRRPGLRGNTVERCVDRDIDYIRFSITDRCNLRCQYCMPQGVPLGCHQDLLTFEEFLQAAQAAVELGITRFKVTGGEPLVRRGCLDFLRRLKALPGVEQVTLTTNGVLLAPLVPALKAMGLDGVNISLDDPHPGGVPGHHWLRFAPPGAGGPFRLRGRGDQDQAQLRAAPRL